MVSKGEIRWQCRRGKLELDLVLRRFLDQHLAACSGTELEGLAALLSHSDEELLDWVLGRSQPEDPDQQAMLARIRASNAPGR